MITKLQYKLEKKEEDKDKQLLVPLALQSPGAESQAFSLSNSTPTESKNEVFNILK